MVSSPPEWGLIGFVVISLLGLLAYWVKASRADLSVTHERFLNSVDRASERDAERSDRQTEAIVASTNATQQSVQALRELAAMVAKHDERALTRHVEAEEAAEARHHALVDRLESIRRERVS